MSLERFNSDLGEVALTDEHLERKRSNSPEWARILQHFSENKLLDEIHFSNINEVRFDAGSIYPNIKVKTDDGWKRIFFHVGDEAKKCYQRLNYKLSVFRQIY